MKTIRTAIAVAAALALGSSVDAAASTVSVDGDGNLLYFAGSAEVNDLALTRGGGVYDLVDTGAAITSDGSCNVLDPPANHHAQCPDIGVSSVSVFLEDLDDRFLVGDGAYPAPSPFVVAMWIRGGDGADRLLGAGGPDTFLGGAGDDVVVGAAGVDALSGGEGGDLVDGGPGDDDVVHGDEGNDAVFGGPGNETVAAQEGDDTVDGGEGDDDAIGGPGNDQVFGGDGDDELDPDAGNDDGRDRLEGGAGDDLLSGGTRDDIVEPDVLTGGPGADTANYAGRRGSLSVSLNDVADDGAAGEGDDVRSNVENVVGGSNSDTLVGNDDGNQLDGGAGDDEVLGRAGRDRLEGGVNDGGSDRLDGGDGEDTIQGGAGDDSVLGGLGDDALGGGGGADALEGQDGQDRLEGGPGIDALAGGDGNDELFGGAGGPLVGADGADDLDGGLGDDALAGGAGNDRLDGGQGADQLSGNEGRDTLSYETRANRVSVTFDGIANDGEAGENDNVVADIEIVLGGSVADTLRGDARANNLDGGSGSDEVRGGAGSDVLTGGTGADVLRARDRVRDVVSCGGEGDLAIADPKDTIRDCPYVDRGGRRRPVLRRSAVLELPDGRFRLPEADRFVSLVGTLSIPFRTTVDPGRSVARVATRRRRGAGRQEAAFWGGAFTLSQGRGRRPVTEVRLKGGGAFDKCSESDRTVRAAGAAQDRPRRGVWGRVGKKHGKFRLKGNHSAGSVRGTTWFTEDRCDGTLTRVVSGTVVVRDFRLRRTVVVDAGESYLARAARPRGRRG